MYLQCPDPRLKMVYNVSKQGKGWVRKKTKAGVVCELLPGLLLRKVRQSVGNAATSLTRFCLPSVGGLSAESVTTHGLYAPRTWSDCQAHETDDEHCICRERVCPRRLVTSSSQQSSLVVEGHAGNLPSQKLACGGRALTKKNPTNQMSVALRTPTSIPGSRL